MPDSVEEIRVFQACDSGWRCDIKCCALAHTRKCAFFPLVSIPCFCDQRERNLTGDVLPSASRLCSVRLQQSAHVFAFSLLSCSTVPVCWSCADSSTHLRLAQDIELVEKNALHGSGAGSLSTVHADLLIMEAQVGQLQAQLAQTQTELQYAIEQIRILTLQVNRNTSAVTTPATTTEPAATSAGYHSRMPKVNHQFGKGIIPNIFDGKQRNDFREWAENSALYLSSQCVDACEILLEWLVMEKEHVTETAIQVKCEEEDWEYDSVSTFSRVTFVYLSMRTTGTARKIATSGKRGDGLNAWRRLFQEYNPQLVTGAQALLRRALSMGRAKNVADVSDRIQELEELVRKYEEHEGCTFAAAFKIQKLMDILPEDAERQLTLESTNTKPNFESLKSRVSQWVLLNHRGRSAMDCSHIGNGGHSGGRGAQMSEHEDNSTWSGRGSEGHDWSGR